MNVPITKIVSIIDIIISKIQKYNKNNYKLMINKQGFLYIMANLNIDEKLMFNIVRDETYIQNFESLLKVERKIIGELEVKPSSEQNEIVVKEYLKEEYILIN